MMEQKVPFLEKGRSSLSGIADIEGDFDLGDAVSCVDRAGVTLAKGLVNYNSADIRKIKGLKTSQISQVLGYKDYDEVIHRNNLVIISNNTRRQYTN